MFGDKQGFSVNSPFLSKTLKGMLGGPVDITNSKQPKKTSVQTWQWRDSAKSKKRTSSKGNQIKTAAEQVFSPKNQLFQ